MTKPAIGIFDSGVGGLTVAAQIMAAQPCRPIVYFGDCLRMPYGDRSPEELAGFAHEIITFLMGHDAQAIIAACGTISSKIFDKVQDMVPAGVPVYGMVQPAVAATIAATRTGRIGIIATEGSVKAKGFEDAIKKERPDAHVVAIACPLFAPLAEEGWHNHPVTDLAAATYLKPLLGEGVDTLLLGCTHYPLLSSSIKKALPEGVAIVDPARYLAKQLGGQLGDGSLREPSPGTGNHKFFVSGKKEKFDKMAKMVLGMDVDAVIAKL